MPGSAERGSSGGHGEPATATAGLADYVAEAEVSARGRLPEEVFGYFAQGAADGVTAAEAVAAWDRFRFLPRVLVDVTHVDAGTTVLGTEVDTPYLVAPMTLQRAAHPDGELATARAAAAMGSLMVVSSNAGTPFSAIGETGVPWWLQMYVTADRARTVPVVERAIAAGARALVLTADTPIVATKRAGRRPVAGVVDPAWLRVNFGDQAGDAEVVEKAADLGPQDVAWLADQFGLPVVVKGVLDPVDARRCTDAGAAAVWVSNHGGRQLDRAVATADALPDIVDAVGEGVEVYVDGGLRRGAHALAAAALGARAVFLGRPVLWALADAGEPGVARLLRELHSELHETLRLSGQPALTAVGRDLLRRP